MSKGKKKTEDTNEYDAPAIGDNPTDETPSVKKAGRGKTDVQKNFNLYVHRIENRINNGEKELSVKPYNEWVRKAKIKDATGNETIIEVSGDTGETKSEKFHRLAESRLNNALAALSKIENLSSPAQYEAKPAQIKFMVDQLKNAVIKIENSFDKRTVKPNDRIKIPV